MQVLQYINQVEVASGLAIALVVWAFGLPSRIFSLVRTAIRTRRLESSTAAGMYDTDTIKAAVKNYISPKYASVDPAEYQEPMAALLDARADLFRAMDLFVAKRNTDAKYLFVLADSGMGKTSFLINYFYKKSTKWRKPSGGFLLMSLSSPVALEQVAAHPIEYAKSTNLLLDAFDEDTQAAGRSGERLKEILGQTASFRTITISCRTQFFISEESIPTETGISRIGAVPLRESKDHKFSKVYLSPFDEIQVKRYLRKRYPGIWHYKLRRKAMEVVHKVPSLSVRPMLLAHIPEIINSSRPVRNSVDVYDEMVSAWAMRESRWIAPPELIRLSKVLALDFYLNRAKRGGEFAPAMEIVALGRGLGISGLEENVTSRSLLNRTASGMFKFAHRSIMEYFIADWILNDGWGRGVEITDQIAKFIAQRLNCCSEAVEVFLTSCAIQVEPEPPEHILGHPTNFSLFRELVVGVDGARLLSISTLGADGKGSILLERLRAFAEANRYAEKERLSRVRIVVRPADSSGYFDCFAVVWFGAVAVCGTFKILRKTIRDMLGGDAIFESEFVISARPVESSWDISNFLWIAEKRSSCVAAEAARVGDISALYNNPSVSFEYNSKDNYLLVRVIQGTWDVQGSGLVFGILSADAVLDPSGAYLVVKPITFDASNRQLRPPQRSVSEWQF